MGVRVYAFASAMLSRLSAVILATPVSMHPAFCSSLAFDRSGRLLIRNSDSGFGTIIRASIPLRQAGWEAQLVKPSPKHGTALRLYDPGRHMGGRGMPGQRQELPLQATGIKPTFYDLATPSPTTGVSSPLRAFGKRYRPSGKNKHAAIKSKTKNTRRTGS
jgi:hypothetical protein